MDFLADILLGAGALAAAFYCMVLSRRLTRLRNLDHDVGGAVAQLSQQVDEMTKVLSQTREAANASSTELTATTERAETVAGKLEIMIAALHDVDSKAPEAAPAPEPEPEAEPLVLKQKAEEISVFMRNSTHLAGGA